MAAGMGPSGNKIKAADGTAVMFVEVSYDYTPLFPGVIPAKRLRYESAFNVVPATVLILPMSGISP